MITARELVASCAREVRIVKHLATKVAEGALQWRPTRTQRSTVELLRYLTACAIVPAHAMVTGDWAHAEAYEHAATAVTPETFAAAMDRQMAEIERVVLAIPERDFLERDATLPWGEKCKLGIALVDTVLKTLVAYRMQLFLYAKESGNPAIGPSDCWVGVSRPAAAS